MYVVIYYITFCSIVISSQRTHTHNDIPLPLEVYRLLERYQFATNIPCFLFVSHKRASICSRVLVFPVAPGYTSHWFVFASISSAVSVINNIGFVKMVTVIGDFKVRFPQVPDQGNLDEGGLICAFWRYMRFSYFTRSLLSKSLRHDLKINLQSQLWNQKTSEDCSWDDLKYKTGLWISSIDLYEAGHMGCNFEREKPIVV